MLIADTAVTERPTAEQYAAIAMRASAFARRMGLEPRVAFTSYTTFGNPPGMHIEGLREAVTLLDGFHADFEYEGEMAPDVALNYDMQKRYLSVHAGCRARRTSSSCRGSSRRAFRPSCCASSAAKACLDPICWACEHPVQIAPMTASASDLVMLAVLAAGDAHARQQRQAARRLDPLDGTDRFGVAQAPR